MKVTVTMEADIPAGYVSTGEFRKANRGEFYLHEGTGTAFLAPQCQTRMSHIILKRFEFKREGYFPTIKVDDDFSISIGNVARVVRESIPEFIMAIQSAYAHIVELEK